MSAPQALGFVGLGQMGQPMAANITKAGFSVLCFDTAGTEGRLPENATAAASLAQVIKNADTVFLSLPDGKIVNAVAEEIAGVPDRRTKVVVDLSTIGPDPARKAAATLAEAGMTYVDAPVSGGRAGAIKGTISLMWAGPKAEFDRHLDILKAFSGNPFHVGDKPGLGQTLKIANNFLSATAMVATSEAVLFGLSQGLDMKTMLDVLNVSSGQNTAVSDKFPNRVLTGTFDGGFFAELQNKDVQLYFENVKKAGTPSRVGTEVAGVWARAIEAFPPKTDFTRIYEFVRDKDKPKD
jgi:3-hydroxyisobutyrate dehydrogenase-like beta-hydroxyacid dehydrogenase